MRVNVEYNIFFLSNFIWDKNVMNPHCSFQFYFSFFLSLLLICFNWMKSLAKWHIFFCSCLFVGYFYMVLCLSFDIQYNAVEILKLSLCYNSFLFFFYYYLKATKHIIKCNNHRNGSFISFSSSSSTPFAPLSKWRGAKRNWKSNNKKNTNQFQRFCAVKQIIKERR